MPTTVAITNSNGTVWSFASTDTPSNTALGGRMHELGLLVDGSATAFVQARPGVLAGAGLTAANTPSSLFASPTGTGLNVQVFPGAGVIERGTFSGAAWSTFTASGTYPYAVALKTTATFATNTANSLAGSRIDRVDLQIFDGPGFGDNSGTSLAQIIYTAGTVGSGVSANAPANSIPLCLITFPSGTTATLTAGMFTDMRRGTSLRGATRMLMGGDSLADAGFAAGEFRMHYNASYATWLEDFWDPVGSTWRGTQILEITQPALSTPGLPSGNTATIASQVIADPGWPYHIVASCSQYGQQTSGVAAGIALLNIAVQVDSATWNTNVITKGNSANYSTSTSVGQFSIAAERNSRSIQANGYTGSHTVYFLGNSFGANISTVADPTDGFHIKLVPA